MRMLYEADPAFLLFFLALLIGPKWPWLIVLITVVAWFCRQSDLHEWRMQRKRADEEDLAARADEQQEQVLDGDPRGSYGAFPPDVQTCVKCGLVECVCDEVRRSRRKPWLTLT